MATKVKGIGQTKLANAEHLYLHIEILKLILECTPEKISAEDEVPKYSDAIDREVGIVKLQTASALTPIMQQRDEERDKYVSYLFATIDNAKNSPLEASIQAHTQLTPVVNPYRGISKHTDSQKTAELTGMLFDLSAEGLSQSIKSLGLDSAIEAINEANNAYLLLNQQRIAEMPSKADTLNIRKAVDMEYNAIVDKINATVILAPNDEAITLVRKINNMIDATNSSYNKRTAKRSSDDSSGDLPAF